MLNNQQILAASLNDIVFDGRNKDYGAYALRTNYNKTMYTAMGIMAAICRGFVLLSFTAKDKKEAVPAYVGAVVDIAPPPIIDPPIPPQPPQPKSVPEAQMIIKTAQFATIEIVPDHLNPEVLPPTQNELLVANIGLKPSDGVDFTGIVAPPQETKGTGLAVALVKEEDTEPNKWIKIGREASFPGGPEAWRRYLEKNLRFPESAIDNGVSGTIAVKFIVDADGTISQVIALNDLGFGLAEEAVRIIKRGPKRHPAEQNGKKVKYTHVQKIGFVIEN